MMGGKTQKGAHAMIGRMTLLVIALAILAAAHPAVAQQAGKIPTIGFLHAGAAGA